MQTLHLYISLSPFRFINFYPKPMRPIRPLLCFFSSVASSLAQANTTTLSSNPFIFNYLIKTFALSDAQALSISNRFKWIKTHKKPESVVQYFKQVGFSDAQIQSTIRVSPQVFFSDLDKTLKPKLQYFLDLGLTGPDLGKLISKNPKLLNRSLEKKLIPCINMIKKILINDKNNQDLAQVLQSFNWIFRDHESRVTCNAAFLKSCGIVGSQLSLLFKRRPRLFLMTEPELKDLVSRALDMGFSIDSRMLVHALYTVSCLSSETFSRKLGLFRSFGFSESEFMEMFRRNPGLLRTSEKKLMFGIEFFLNDIKIERSVLVHRPTCLMHSIEERVIPRYRVLQVLKSKMLLKKEPSFPYALSLPEDKFLEKYISRFRDDAEVLLVAYKGHLCSSGE